MHIVVQANAFYQLLHAASTSILYGIRIAFMQSKTFQIIFFLFSYFGREISTAWSKKKKLVLRSLRLYSTWAWASVVCACLWRDGSSCFLTSSQSFWFEWSVCVCACVTILWINHKPSARAKFCCWCVEVNCKQLKFMKTICHTPTEFNLNKMHQMSPGRWPLAETPHTCRCRCRTSCCS